MKKWIKNKLKYKTDQQEPIGIEPFHGVERESEFKDFRTYEHFKGKAKWIDKDSNGFPKRPANSQIAGGELGDAVKTIIESVTDKGAHQGGYYRYQTIKQIGEGGTATVYRALDKRLNREVALKRFHKKTNITTTNSKYLKELEVITRLDHPNIVTTHDMGSDQAGDFIVMSLINGLDLEEYLKQKLLGKVDFKEFALQILEGCSEMHSKEVLHLDLKPSNIMVVIRPSGRILAKIIDFGAAKIKNTKEETGLAGKRSVNGSIHFMSPEDMNKEDLDERSDIYSLGCVFYQALTGELPFKGDNAVLILAAHIQNHYTPLDELITNVPRELIDLIHQMISLKPNDRPRSAGEVLHRINEMPW